MSLLNLFPALDRLFFVFKVKNQNKKPLLSSKSNQSILFFGKNKSENKRNKMEKNKSKYHYSLQYIYIHIINSLMLCPFLFPFVHMKFLKEFSIFLLTFILINLKYTYRPINNILFTLNTFSLQRKCTS